MNPELSLPGEEWKPLPDFPSNFISNKGRVMSYCERGGLHTSVGWFIRTPTKDNNVYLKLNGHNVKRRVSRLLRENWSDWWKQELDDDEVVTPVRGFPGYFITSKGRVFSERQQKFLKPTHQKPYYWGITLRQGLNRKQKCFIHTLVGRHFLPYTGGFILHKEETLSYPEINFVSNLWVGTQQDNVLDTFRKGRSNR
jgi:hypothetical protein